MAIGGSWVGEAFTEEVMFQSGVLEVRYLRTRSSWQRRVQADKP
jgi:hypothetical protein